MSVDAGVLVGRRSRAEIERLVALYGSSGMGRIEFCRSQGLALSTLGRHLRKQRSKPSESRSKGVERGRLMPVELAAPVASVIVLSIVSVRRTHIDSYRLLAAQAVGVSSGSLWMDELASPGRTAARYSRTGILSRRQVSTMERIAATRGPAFSCPMWVQLRRPIATGRMEFSARLLLSSSSG